MDSPIRVLHVVVNMNRGGAETLVMNLYRNIDRSIVQFDFLTCKDGIFDSEIEAMGGKIHRIPYITDGGPFKYIHSLKTFFKNHPEYKIVHSHMDKMSGFVLRAAKKSGVPVRIAHSHGTQSEGNYFAKVVKWYAGKFILNNANHLLACSKKASSWLYGKKADESKIVNNGIDLYKYQFSNDVRAKMREQWNLKRDSFIVGHVGRFCTPKNHDFLIDIFNEIHQQNLDAYLILVGDGPHKEQIKEKVKQLGIEKNVLFLGIQNNVHEILQAFDVMVFPSIHEGLPVTLVEAQSIGLPCIISDRITREVDMGASLITVESLNTSSKIWAMRALLIDITKRDARTHIKNKGYDIQQSANWMQDFYLFNTMSYVRGETG